MDKMDKANSEMKRTNQRLIKLNFQKQKMEKDRALMAQSDHPRTLKQTHAEYKTKINLVLDCVGKENEKVDKRLLNA